MNVHVRFSAVAVFAALTLSAAPLAAQSATLDPSDVSATHAGVGLVPSTVIDSVTALASSGATVPPASSATPLRGPSLASARVASHTTSTPLGAPPALQNRTSNRNAVALMIVGGAALVLGAVIGNDAGKIVMVGGAGIGLYGLYLFLT